MTALRRHVEMYFPFYCFANVLVITGFAMLPGFIQRKGYAFSLAEAVILMTTAFKPFRPATILVERALMLIGFVAMTMLLPNLMRGSRYQIDARLWLVIIGAFAVWWMMVFAFDLNRANKLDDTTSRRVSERLSPYLLACVAVYHGARALIELGKRRISPTGAMNIASVASSRWWVLLNRAEHWILVGSLTLLFYFSRRVIREAYPETKA